MNKDQIIRAWKDEDYRSSLSIEESSLLPEHPAGIVALTAAELDGAVGGTLDNQAAGTEVLVSLGCCQTGFPSWFFSCTNQCGGLPATFDYFCK